MDRGRFDAVARVVFAELQQSRRAALATVLGATLLRFQPAPAVARRRRTGRGRGRVMAQAASSCYPGTRCTPGKGKNTSGCDFSFSTLFRNRDVRGANLSRSSFRGADLRGADLRGTNLSGACFTGASLEGAKLGASVNRHGAIFCNTVMPDGSNDGSGCAKTSACCRPIEEDCADAVIRCGIPDGFGFCDPHIGNIGPVGHCYHFPCCGPCQNNDEDFWSSQCNAMFPTCSTNGPCVATDTGTIPCWEGCAG
jgi:hypothetical protein